MDEESKAAPERPQPAGWEPPTVLPTPESGPVGPWAYRPLGWGQPPTDLPPTDRPPTDLSPSGPPAWGLPPTGAVALGPPAFGPPPAESRLAGWRQVGRSLVSGSVGVALVAALIGALVGGGIAVATRGTKTIVQLQSPAGSTPASFGAPSAGESQALTSPGPDAFNIRAILARVEPAVVSVHTYEGRAADAQEIGAGTGMILTADGLILTNAHVTLADENSCTVAPSIRVTLADSTAPKPVDVVAIDCDDDIALLRLPGSTKLPTVSLGNSAGIEVGDTVVAIGNALDLAGGPTVTEGIISAIGRPLEGNTEDLFNLLQTDAAINPGNSGGPLVNAAGQVIGMNTAVIDQASAGQTAENLGFAIAVNTIRPIVNELQTGKASKAFLGVQTADVTPDVADRLGLSVDSGAIVEEVEPGSAADKAGLRMNDVVVAFDGKPITDSGDLVSAIRQANPGQQVTLTVERGTKTLAITVTLGSASLTSTH